MKTLASLLFLTLFLTGCGTNLEPSKINETDADPNSEITVSGTVIRVSNSLGTYTPVFKLVTTNNEYVYIEGKTEDIAAAIEALDERQVNVTGVMERQTWPVNGIWYGVDVLKVSSLADVESPIGTLPQQVDSLEVKFDGKVTRMINSLGTYTPDFKLTMSNNRYVYIEGKTADITAVIEGLDERQVNVTGVFERQTWPVNGIWYGVDVLVVSSILIDE